MIALPAGVLASGFSEQLRQRREEYLDRVDKVLQEGTAVTARERRRLEEARVALGLSHEEAVHILEYGVKGGHLHCPHCGERIHRNPAP
jgi:voltage-gated potassium channel